MPLGETANAKRRKKKQRRHWEKVAFRHDEELFRISQIDPLTVEGQADARVTPVGETDAKGESNGSCSIQ